MRACIHGCMSAVARCVRRPARGMTPRARQVVGNVEEIERRRPPPLTFIRPDALRVGRASKLRSTVMGLQA